MKRTFVMWTCRNPAPFPACGWATSTAAPSSISSPWRHNSGAITHTMKVLKIIGLVLGIVILLLAITGFVLFGGLQGAAAGLALGAGIDRVQAGFASVYVLDAGNG